MATLFQSGQLSAGGGAVDLEIEKFLIASPIPSTFTLGAIPATDSTGDSIIEVKLNGLAAGGSDFTLAANVVTWTSSVTLEVGDTIEIFYQSQ